MPELDKGESDMEKEQLIENILDLEWPRFSSINAADAKASCQMDGERFRKMRSCQYECWSGRRLACWLADLREAEQMGRNLPLEKYIRMMEITDPVAYSQFSSDLPEISADVRELADKIIAIQVRWKEDADRRYPALMNHSRASRTDGSSNRASFENYLRSELLTCSSSTLNAWLDDVSEKLEKNINEVEEAISNQVMLNGFTSLEAANEYCARQNR